MIWIKICGITNRQDLEQAARAGANAIGLVLAPSRRQLTLQQMAELAACTPPGLQAVAVVTALQPEMVDAVRRAGLTTVQLHGPAEPRAEELEMLAGLRLIRAVPLRSRADLERPRPAWPWAWLVDSPPGEHAGGTGVACDWQLAERAVGIWSGRVILAGGLNPENVAAAITQVCPWGVDVSTGVEAAPGRKDAERMAAFVRAVRASEETRQARSAR